MQANAAVGVQNLQEAMKVQVGDFKKTVVKSAELPIAWT